MSAMTTPARPGVQLDRRTVIRSMAATTLAVAANGIGSRRGGRGNNTNWRIDGGNVQNIMVGDQGLTFDPPIESLQEFSVSVSNYSAELGRTGGDRPSYERTSPCVSVTQVVEQGATQPSNPEPGGLAGPKNAGPVIAGLAYPVVRSGRLSPTARLPGPPSWCRRRRC